MRSWRTLRGIKWELVDPPPRCKTIGTKWVSKNKEGEKGEVVRNKSRLVALEFNQKEGIDYEETFVRIMCGSRNGGWSLPCVMSD
jgi:hypothetical protein